MISIGRIAKATGRLIFQDEKFLQTAEKTLAGSKKAQGWTNIHKQIGDAFVKAEQATAKESFWGSLKKLVTDIPKDLEKGWAAKGAWGKFKGIGGQLLRRLPLLLVALEIPNIYSAFKDEGLVGGVKETLKSGTRLAAGMAGFTIGQALIPIPLLGGLIGCFATEWLTGKILGKSHSEKKAEKEEALAQAGAAEQQASMLQQQLAQEQLLANQANMFTQNPYAQSGFSTLQSTMTPQQLMTMQQMLQGGYGLPNGNYMDQDFMAMSSGMNLNCIG